MAFPGFGASRQLEANAMKTAFGVALESPRDAQPGRPMSRSKDSRSKDKLGPWHLADSVRRWLALIRLWWGRSRERDMLVAMSERELRDIGITRYDAYIEGRKPFWRG